MGFGVRVQGWGLGLRLRVGVINAAVLVQRNPLSAPKQIGVGVGVGLRRVTVMVMVKVWVMVMVRLWVKASVRYNKMSPLQCSRSLGCCRPRRTVGRPLVGRPQGTVGRPLVGRPQRTVDHTATLEDFGLAFNGHLTVAYLHHEYPVPPPPTPTVAP